MSGKDAHSYQGSGIEELGQLILASASPRRRELLSLITDNFRVYTKDTDETVHPGTPPDKAVELLALRKARAVEEDCAGRFIIAADTVVSLDGAIMGKPANRHEAVVMLEALSGRTHSVYTGVAVCRGGIQEVFSVCTDVTFYPIPGRVIQGYADTPEPYDKAGGYGIQGKGALFVKGIAGDYYTVMGLPVSRLYYSLLEIATSFF